MLIHKMFLFALCFSLFHSLASLAGQENRTHNRGDICDFSSGRGLVNCNQVLLAAARDYNVLQHQIPGLERSVVELTDSSIKLQMIPDQSMDSMMTGLWNRMKSKPDILEKLREYSRDKGLNLNMEVRPVTLPDGRVISQTPLHRLSRQDIKDLMNPAKNRGFYDSMGCHTQWYKSDDNDLCDVLQEKIPERFDKLRVAKLSSVRGQLSNARRSLTHLRGRASSLINNGGNLSSLFKDGGLKPNIGGKILQKYKQNGLLAELLFMKGNLLVQSIKGDERLMGQLMGEIDNSLFGIYLEKKMGDLRSKVDQDIKGLFMRQLSKLGDMIKEQKEEMRELIEGQKVTDDQIKQILAKLCKTGTDNNVICMNPAIVEINRSSKSTGPLK